MRTIGGFHRPRVTCLGVLLALLLALASQAAAQPQTVPDQPLVIEGRVLWVDFGNSTMALAPDRGPAIPIDLRRLPQSAYQGFNGTEYVRIVGYILRPSRRIQAYELYLVTPWYPAEPQNP